MSEINSRHYKRMQRACEDYLSRAASLAATIGALEGLIAALEDISQDLRNDFLARWGLLEDLYAISIDQPERDVIAQNQARLDRAVSEIRDAAHMRAASESGS